MTTRVPLVGIALPVYNGENFVAQAIQCMLDQTFSDWEMVISDNASTDRTLSICREFADHDRRIRIYQSPRNMGVSFNFNQAYRLSRGRFFKWITHDDLFAPEFIETCIQELETDERVVLAFPRIAYVDADGRLLRRQSSDLSILGETGESRVRRLMELAAQSADIFWTHYGLIRREVLEQTRLVGLYGGGDQTLILELALRGCFKQVPKDLFFRREHSAAATLRVSWTARDRAKFHYADDRRRLVFPYCRMLKEHLISVMNGPIPFWDRLRCAHSVMKRFVRQWKYFAEEAIFSPLDLLRSNN